MNKPERKFDELVSQRLRDYTPTVPSDFTKRMMRRIREVEEQRILARVVIEERLALAGCILLAVVAILTAAIFPEAVTGLSGHIETFVGKVYQMLEAAGFFAVFTAMIVFVVYSLVELLVDES